MKRIDIKDRRIAQLEKENDELKAEMLMIEKREKIKQLISVLPESGRTELLIDQLMKMDTEEKMEKRINDQLFACDFNKGKVVDSGEEFDTFHESDKKEAIEKDKKEILDAVSTERRGLKIIKGGQK